MGKFNLRNFIGKHNLSVREKITATQAEEPKQKKSSESSFSAENTKTVQCAKCKKNFELKIKSYIFAYNKVKKDYIKYFLCENCRGKCKKCSKAIIFGVFVYIYDEAQGEYKKYIYCNGCYKDLKFKKCSQCKRVTNFVDENSCCKLCDKTEEKGENSSKEPETNDISKLGSQTSLKDYGYRKGQKVKIYNEDNKSEFVEIIWPDNPTPDSVMKLVMKVRS